MAMNKAEKELVEQLKTDLALRHTPKVFPDVPPPITGSRFDALTVGFLPIAGSSESARVESACSSSIHHGTGSQTKTSSQNPRHLYSTKLLALQALRNEAEKECARRLRRIDKMIEALGDAK